MKIDATTAQAESLAQLALARAGGGSGPSTVPTHLIDTVLTPGTVTPAGSGAVVALDPTLNNTVALALFAGQFGAHSNAYGVYEGTPGQVVTTGVVPDIQIAPDSNAPTAGQFLYVSATYPGTVTTNGPALGQTPFAEVVDATGYSSSHRKVKAYLRPVIYALGT